MSYSLIDSAVIWLTIFACPALLYRSLEYSLPLLNSSTSVDCLTSDLQMMDVDFSDTFLTDSSSWVCKVPFESKWMRRSSYIPYHVSNLTCITTVWSELKNASLTWCLNLTGSKSSFLLPGEGIIANSHYLPLSLASTSIRFVDPDITWAIVFISVVYTSAPVLLSKVF